MTPQEYIEQRLNDQQTWLSNKSGQNKKRYITIQSTLIVLASLVTLVSVFDFPELKYITALIGALIAILTGIQSLNKYQDHWIEYRTTAESLKREYFLFETKCDPYNTRDSFPVLVERVEQILANENLNWQERVKREEGGSVNADPANQKGDVAEAESGTE
jgi:hypothetical protein